jgi:hypothetical protein
MGNAEVGEKMCVRLLVFESSLACIVFCFLFESFLGMRTVVRRSI